MPTAHLPTSDWFSRGTRTAATRDPKRAIPRPPRMLIRDAQRPRPPITLAGQRASDGVVPQPASPLLPDERPKWTGTPRGHGSRTMPGGAEPTAADGEGPYSRSELE